MHHSNVYQPIVAHFPPCPPLAANHSPTHLHPAERCEGVVDAWRDVPCSPSSVALLTQPPALNLPQFPPFPHSPLPRRTL